MSKRFHLPSALFHISVCIVAFIANSFVLVVIWKDPKKCLRTRSAMLVTSLLLSDLFAAAINMTNTVRDVLFEEILPKPVGSVIVIGSYGTLMISFITIFLISLEHLLVITHPIKFKILFTKKWMAWIIASTWLSCTILLTVVYQLPRKNDLLQSITGCSVLLLIALPTIYARAFLSLKQQSKAIKAANDSAGNSGKQKRISHQRNFLLTSAALVLAYLLTTAPFTFHQYLKTSQNPDYNVRKEDRLGQILWTLLCFNLLLDPFLYCLRIPQYRKSCAIMCKSARN